MPSKPASVTIFTYQVGFGDCFLLRFAYPDRNRHVLIDFGTTGLPADVASDQLLTIANDIAVKCNGRLDAVVATHRHADHISGFSTKADGRGSGDVIRSLKPALVLQPWTEQPDLAIDATAPTSVALTGLRSTRQALRHMHAISQEVVDRLTRDPQAFSASIAGQMRFIGEDNLANLSAVQNLATMSQKRVYAFHGSPSGLDAILPGVKTTVLGPPTLQQTTAISKEAASNPAEFWQLRRRRLADDADIAGRSAPIFPKRVSATGGKLPMPVRWLAYRMREARGEQMLQIVRSLDKQMNNTSLILLFDTGSRKLLFPGDAQIENWQYALSKPNVRALLADVDVYKVGHHGSRNATPRSMWAQFNKKGPRTKPGRLTTLMSTMPGKHGHDASNTEVPRKTLLKELTSQSDLHSTHLLPSGQLCNELVIKL